MLLSLGVGEDSWESPDCKKIQPVHPKRNQSWILIGRTDAEAPILWPPAAKNQLIGKDPDAGKDWRQEEKGMIEYEMVGWHHWLNVHESEQCPEDSEKQESLACCSLQFSSVAQSCPTLCDRRNCSTPGFPFHHKLLRVSQTHVHQVSDVIQPSYPLSSPSPPAFSPSQHQGLFQWISSSHQVAKVLKLQHQFMY